MDDERNRRQAGGRLFDIGPEERPAPRTKGASAAGSRGPGPGRTRRQSGDEVGSDVTPPDDSRDAEPGGDRRVTEPLAVRMRPRALSEMVGQEHVLGPGTLLRKAIEGDLLTSIIVFGPPGSGKTTLASVIANTTRARFEQLNAVSSGVAEVRRVAEAAVLRKASSGRKTIVFIDEIHRFNKAQQDVLLPYVERGDIVLIGATVYNPFFEVNAPLVSRSRLIRLEPLAPDQVRTLMERALADEEQGLARLHPVVEAGVLEHMSRVAGGDARVALNALEFAVETAQPGPDGGRRVTLAQAEDALQRRALLYDRDGDMHFDTISAFIKSMRGSDPDAAVYWLVRMIEAGEDPEFVARRIVIQAAEDVGNADPQALVVAMAAADAVRFVGLPEARLPLAQAAIYVACAPKSNAVYRALEGATRDVKAAEQDQVPAHLRDASYPGAARLGHGAGYLYPHDFPGGVVSQNYLPANLQGRVYYEPTRNGFESVIAGRLTSVREELKTRADGGAAIGGRGVES